MIRLDGGRFSQLVASATLVIKEMPRRSPGALCPTEHYKLFICGKGRRGEFTPPAPAAVLLLLVLLQVVLLLAT